MPELDTLTWLIIAFIGLAISLWIMYEIIKAASKSSRITELLQEQNRLLGELLERDKPQPESSSFTPGKVSDLNDPEVLNTILQALPKKKE